MSALPLPAIEQQGNGQAHGFRHSRSFAKLADALRQAQNEFPKLEKEAENPFYNSKYATLDSVIEATRPALSKYGLVVTQPATTHGRMVIITTLMVHPASEEFIAVDLELPGESYKRKKGERGEEDGQQLKFDAQTIGSAISYGRRYGYKAICGIAESDDDDDGNLASGNFVRQPERIKPPQSLAAAKAPHKGMISEAEHTEFWTATKKAKKTTQQVNCYLRGQGIESSTMIPLKDFKKHLEWARNGA